jgi:hypothetical protein
MVVVVLAVVVVVTMVKALIFVVVVVVAIIVVVLAATVVVVVLLVIVTITPWLESAIELYRPSDHRLSATLVPTFADRGVWRGQCGRTLRP